MIEPTPGRVVWYRPGKQDPLRSVQEERPLAAIVAWVNSPTSVNLTVADRSGRWHPRVQVPLLQDGETTIDATESHCEWMPYQKAVAAGTIEPTRHASTKAPQAT